MQKQTKEKHMSNTVTETPLSLERNGITKTLIKGVFGKKSKNPGVEFWTPDFAISDFETDAKWVGYDRITQLMYRDARKAFGDIHLMSINPDTGLVDLAKWKAQAEDYTAGASTLDDLEAEIDQLMDQSLVYGTDERLGEVDANGVETEYSAMLVEKIKEFSNKMLPLRKQRAVIKAKYAEIVAARDAKKAAEATAAEAKAA